MSKSSTSDNVFLAVVLIGAGLIVTHFGNDFFLKFEETSNSISHGTPVKGRLEHGKRLPSSGPNFETYSRLGALIGRTHVHHQVRQAVLGAYADVYEKDPDLRFVYGETGWWDGGDFYPHRTHQNGLVVDFMVPVRRSGESVVLPHSIIDKFGYGIDFSDAGLVDGYQIDFDAMNLHLLALRTAASENGLRIKRVIFAPELQKKLFKAKRGGSVKKRFTFNRKEAWVRHDDHYHVEFEHRRKQRRTRAKTSAPAGEPEDDGNTQSADEKKAHLDRPEDLEVWPELPTDGVPSEKAWPEIESGKEKPPSKNEEGWPRIESSKAN